MYLHGACSAKDDFILSDHHNRDNYIKTQMSRRTNGLVGRIRHMKLQVLRREINYPAAVRDFYQDT